MIQFKISSSWLKSHQKFWRMKRNCLGKSFGEKKNVCLDFCNMLFWNRVKCFIGSEGWTPQDITLNSSLWGRGARCLLSLGATDSDNWLGDREQFNICPSISSLFLGWRGAKAYFKNIWETIPGFSPWIRHWIAARFPYLLYTLAVTIIAAPDMGRKTRPKWQHKFRI